MKKTIGILVCTLLIAIAFIPVSNAISFGSISFFNDTTPPEMSLYWEKTKLNNNKWDVYFTAICYDNQSGMSRVEVYVNNQLTHVIPAQPWLPEPEKYVFPLFSVTRADLKGLIFKFVAFDKAGNSAFIEVNGSDVLTCPSSQQSITQNSEFIQNTMVTNR